MDWATHSTLPRFRPFGHIHTGVDLSALEGVLDAMSFDKLLNQPEMQRFIDQARCSFLVHCTHARMLGRV